MTPTTVQRLAVAALIVSVAAVHQPDPGFGRPAVRATLFLALIASSVVLLAHHRHARRSLVYWPAAAFTAAIGWIVLMSPLGLAGFSGVITGVGLMATLGLAAVIEQRFGFSGFERVLAPTLLFLLSHAAIFELIEQNPDRWLAWAEEPNALGVLAALGFVAGARALRDGVIPLLPLIPVSLVILYQTDARVPLIAGVLGGVVIWRPRLRRGGAAFIVIAGLLLSLFVLGSGRLGDPVIGEEGFESISTLTGRTKLWDHLLREMNSRPLTGFGPDTTYDVSNSGGEVSWNPRHAHNIVLQAAVHAGWPAAALLLVAAVAVVIARRRDPHAERDAYLACLALIGLTEHILREPTIPFLILCVGVVSVQPARKRSNARPSAAHESATPALV